MDRTIPSHSPIEMNESEASRWIPTDLAAEILAQRGVLVIDPISKRRRAPTAQVVRIWCVRGHLPCIKVGRYYLILKDALDNFRPPPLGRPKGGSRRRRGRNPSD